MVGAQPAAANERPPAEACPGADAIAAAAGAEVDAMRCLVNWVRAQHGLTQLRELSELNRSSGLRSGAIRRCGQFSHTPCGQAFVQPFVRAGYYRGSVSVGENLAWGSSWLGSPRATLAAWLRSPGHRANLLHPAWRDCGFALTRGRLFGAPGVSLWVLQFGRRN
jgi:uncharacterized protein YkwD